MQLQWHKNPRNHWCALDEIDLGALDHAGTQHGVFVIWRGGSAAQMSVVLYVGRGFLPRELANCRRDPLFRTENGLHVTWANVAPRDVDGVAAYLYDQLRPLWGEVVSSVQPMAVNLPLTG